MEYAINDNLKVRIYVNRRNAKNGKPFHEYLICGEPDPLLLKSRDENDQQYYQNVKIFDFDCKLEHDGIYDVNLQRFKNGNFFGWQFVGVPFHLKDEKQGKKPIKSAALDRPMKSVKENASKSKYSEFDHANCNCGHNRSDHDGNGCNMCSCDGYNEDLPF